MFTVPLIAPEPEAVQLEPTEAAHVQLWDVTPAGTGSETFAPTESDGPLFVTTIV
jgi:hypothetical protein